MWEELLPAHSCTQNQAGIQLPPLVRDSLGQTLKPFGNSCKEMLSVCGQKRGKSVDRSAYKMYLCPIWGLYVQVLRTLGAVVSSARVTSRGTESGGMVDVGVRGQPMAPGKL